MQSKFHQNLLENYTLCEENILIEGLLNIELLDKNGFDTLHTKGK